MLSDSYFPEKTLVNNRRLGKQDTLFSAGDELHSVYSVRSGFFRSTALLGAGIEQVTGFQMSGDALGLEGIESGRYESTVVALENSHVCVIPYPRVGGRARDRALSARQMQASMGLQIVRHQGAMCLLGGARCEERVASFLLDLSERYAARGNSRTEFLLRATRHDIGSLLGMTLETVSRTMSAFEDDGLLAVSGKQLRITDLEGLKLRALAKDAVTRSPVHAPG